MYEIGGKEGAIRAIEAAGGSVVQHIEGVRVLVLRSLTQESITSLASDVNIMLIEVCHHSRCL